MGKIMLKEFTWCVNAGASQTIEMRTNVTRFGDGYEQRSSFGINNARKAWSCSKTAYKSEIDAIERFLLEHKGVTPFYMTFDGDKDSYFTDGEIETSHQSGNVWNINFKVVQSFQP